MSEPRDLSRRAFVLGTAASVAMSAADAKVAAAGAKVAAAGAEVSADGPGRPAMSVLCNLSAVDAVAHMSEGSLAAEHYAQALLRSAGPSTP